MLTYTTSHPLLERFMITSGNTVLTGGDCNGDEHLPLRLCSIVRNAKGAARIDADAADIVTHARPLAVNDVLPFADNDTIVGARDEEFTNRFLCIIKGSARKWYPYAVQFLPDRLAVFYAGPRSYEVAIIKDFQETINIHVPIFNCKDGPQACLQCHCLDGGNGFGPTMWVQRVDEYATSRELYRLSFDDPETRNPYKVSVCVQHQVPLITPLAQQALLDKFS